MQTIRNYYFVHYEKPEIEGELTTATPDKLARCQGIQWQVGTGLMKLDCCFNEKFTLLSKTDAAHLFMLFVLVSKFKKVSFRAEMPAY